MIWIVAIVTLNVGFLIGVWWNAAAYDRGYTDGYRHGTADADRHWTARGAVWRPMPHK